MKQKQSLYLYHLSRNIIYENHFFSHLYREIVLKDIVVNSFEMSFLLRYQVF